MNKLLKSMLCLTLLVATLVATGQRQKNTRRERPAAADRSRDDLRQPGDCRAHRFRPNGKYLSFLKPWKDTRNV